MIIPLFQAPGRAIFSPFKAISGPGRTFTRADLFQALLGLYMAPGRALLLPGYFRPRGPKKTLA